MDATMQSAAIMSSRSARERVTAARPVTGIDLVSYKERAAGAAKRLMPEPFLIARGARPERGVPGSRSPAIQRSFTAAPGSDLSATDPDVPTVRDVSTGAVSPRGAVSDPRARSPRDRE